MPFSVSDKDTQIGFRAHSIIKYDLILIITLITSSKTIFPGHILRVGMNSSGDSIQPATQGNNILTLVHGNFVGVKGNNV